MAVYRNKKDMEIPSFAYPNRSDGSVFIVVIDENGTRHRKTIGALTDGTKGQERMVPNQYFRDHYQDLWNKAYPDEKVPLHQMSIGMYALVLAITSQLGVYEDLQNVYGPVYANCILDYVMFCILHRSDVTQIYQPTMKGQVLFADKLYSDSWYSRFFSKDLDEDHHHQFRIAWVNHLVANGLKKVWLAVDGSNNDCEARKSFLAKFGFPKSHNKNKTIVGYMYAVDAGTGRPVTYFVYEGSVPDSQAFQKMATFLNGSGIEIEGIILDRGFAVEEVFHTIEEYQWKYIIMLPVDTYGHIQMLGQYRELIRWKSQYMLEDEVLFGVADTMKLFGNHDRTSNICLFFDGSSGSIQSVRLSKKILQAVKKIEKAIRSGSRAAVNKDLKKYLSIEGEGSERKVVKHFDQWDNSMAGKGYYSIAASDGIIPQQANALYKMRDTSETQYCILKSQEGGSTSRVHKTAGIYSKFAILFISSVVRFEIEHACKELGLDTNPTIQGLDQIALLYTAEDKYQAVRNLTAEQKSLFSHFGLTQDDVERFARDFNRRNQSMAKNPIRTLPDQDEPLIVSNSHKKGRQPKSDKGDEEVTIKISVGGRPKGSKDTKPRKPRSDKGKKRGPRANN